jgi:hypothetical protein
MRFLLGGDSITVFANGKPYTVNRTAKIFNAALDAVKNDDVELFLQVVNTKDTVVQKSGGKVRIENGNLMFGDRVVTGLISARVFDMMELGLSIDPMMAFIDNLMKNPSKRAVDELFSFIEACDLPITEDGHFLAYKRVREDYKDVHSGTMDNSVGQVVEMERNLVDEDKSRTCSAGLHFCSYEYLKHFSGERIVVVKINPADVVAIPIDYNNSKGRTCRYEVVEEMEIVDRLPTQRLDTKYVAEKQKKVTKSSNRVKMTQDLADDLRAEYHGGNSVEDLMEDYDLSRRQVMRILNYEAWV